MNLISKFTETLIFSNIWVSICIVCLYQAFSIMINEQNNDIIIFLFFSTLSCYNFQRIVKSKQANYKYSKWISKFRPLIKTTIVISSAISIFYFLKFKITTQIFIVCISLISILYPFILRKIPYIKIFIISIIWTISISILIIFEEKIKIDIDLILFTVTIFLFVFSITIPFDIRDIKYDNEKLKTLPIVLGEQKSKIISLSSLVISLFIYSYLFIDKKLFFSQYIGILCFLFIMTIMIDKVNKEQSDFYVSFWIESTSIIFCLILALTSWSI